MIWLCIYLYFAGMLATLIAVSRVETRAPALIIAIIIATWPVSVPVGLALERWGSDT